MDLIIRIDHFGNKTFTGLSKAGLNVGLTISLTNRIRWWAAKWFSRDTSYSLYYTAFFVIHRVAVARLHKHGLYSWTVLSSGQPIIESRDKKT
jgi:hypothetical protein